MESRSSPLMDKKRVLTEESQSLLDESLVGASQPISAEGDSFCGSSQPAVGGGSASATSSVSAGGGAGLLVPASDDSDTDFEGDDEDAVETQPAPRRLKDCLIDDDAPLAVNDTLDTSGVLSEGPCSGNDARDARSSSKAEYSRHLEKGLRVVRFSECDDSVAESLDSQAETQPRRVVFKSPACKALSSSLGKASTSSRTSSAVDSEAETQLYEHRSVTSSVDLEAETQAFGASALHATTVNLEAETQVFDTSLLNSTAGSVDLMAETQPFKGSPGKSKSNTLRQEANSKARRLDESSSKYVDSTAETRGFATQMNDSVADIDLEAPTQVYLEAPVPKSEHSSDDGETQPFDRLDSKSLNVSDTDLLAPTQPYLPDKGSDAGLDCEAETELFIPQAKESFDPDQYGCEAETEMYHPGDGENRGIRRSEVTLEVKPNNTCDVDCEAATQIYMPKAQPANSAVRNTAAADASDSGSDTDLELTQSLSLPAVSASNPERDESGGTAAGTSLSRDGAAGASATAVTEHTISDSGSETDASECEARATLSGTSRAAPDSGSETDIDDELVATQVVSRRPPAKRFRHAEEDGVDADVGESRAVAAESSYSGADKSLPSRMHGADESQSMLAAVRMDVEECDFELSEDEDLVETQRFPRQAKVESNEGSVGTQRVAAKSEQSCQAPSEDVKLAPRLDSVDEDDIETERVALHNPNAPTEEKYDKNQKRTTVTEVSFDDECDIETQRRSPVQKKVTFGEALVATSEDKGAEDEVKVAEERKNLESSPASVPAETRSELKEPSQLLQKSGSTCLVSCPKAISKSVSQSEHSGKGLSGSGIDDEAETEVATRISSAPAPSASAQSGSCDEEELLQTQLRPSLSGNVRDVHPEGMVSSDEEDLLQTQVVRPMKPPTETSREKPENAETVKDDEDLLQTQVVRPMKPPTGVAREKPEETGIVKDDEDLLQTQMVRPMKPHTAASGELGDADAVTDDEDLLQTQMVVSIKSRTEAYRKVSEETEAVKDPEDMIATQRMPSFRSIPTTGSSAAHVAKEMKGFKEDEDMISTQLILPDRAHEEGTSPEPRRSEEEESGEKGAKNSMPAPEPSRKSAADASAIRQVVCSTPSPVAIRLKSRSSTPPPSTSTPAKEGPSPRLNTSGEELFGSPGLPKNSERGEPQEEEQIPETQFEENAMETQEEGLCERLVLPSTQDMHSVLEMIRSPTPPPVPEEPDSQDPAMLMDTQQVDTWPRCVSISPVPSGPPAAARTPESPSCASDETGSFDIAPDEEDAASTHGDANCKEADSGGDADRNGTGPAVNAPSFCDDTGQSCLKENRVEVEAGSNREGAPECETSVVSCRKKLSFVPADDGDMNTSQEASVSDTASASAARPETSRSRHTDVLPGRETDPAAFHPSDTGEVRGRKRRSLDVVDTSGEGKNDEVLSAESKAREAQGSLSSRARKRGRGSAAMSETSRAEDSVHTAQALSSSELRPAGVDAAAGNRRSSGRRVKAPVKFTPTKTPKEEAVPSKRLRRGPVPDKGSDGGDGPTGSKRRRRQANEAGTAARSGDAKASSVPREVSEAGPASARALELPSVVIDRMSPRTERAAIEGCSVATSRRSEGKKGDVLKAPAGSVEMTNISLSSEGDRSSFEGFLPEAVEAKSKCGPSSSRVPNSQTAISSTAVPCSSGKETKATNATVAVPVHAEAERLGISRLGSEQAGKRSAAAPSDLSPRVFRDGQRRKTSAMSTATAAALAETDVSPVVSKPVQQRKKRAAAARAGPEPAAAAAGGRSEVPAAPGGTSEVPAAAGGTSEVSAGSTSAQLAEASNARDVPDAGHGTRTRSLRGRPSEHSEMPTNVQESARRTRGPQRVSGNHEASGVQVLAPPALTLKPPSGRRGRSSHSAESCTGSSVSSHDGVRGASVNRDRLRADGGNLTVVNAGAGQPPQRRRGARGRVAVNDEPPGAFPSPAKSETSIISIASAVSTQSVRSTRSTRSTRAANAAAASLDPVAEDARSTRSRRGRASRGSTPVVCLTSSTDSSPTRIAPPASSGPAVLTATGRSARGRERGRGRRGTTARGRPAPSADVRLDVTAVSEPAPAAAAATAAPPGSSRLRRIATVEADGDSGEDLPRPSGRSTRRRRSVEVVHVAPPKTARGKRKPVGEAVSSESEEAQPSLAPAPSATSVSALTVRRGRGRPKPASPAGSVSSRASAVVKTTPPAGSPAVYRPGGGSTVGETASGRGRRKRQQLTSDTGAGSSHGPSVTSAADLETDSIVSLSSQASLRSSVTGSGRTLAVRSRPRVLFTGFADDGHERTVLTLGGEVVEQPSLCTVLVAAAVKRTIKFMSAFALGVPIVTPAWVTKSKQAKCFLDPWDFLVRDVTVEAKFGFRLDQSLRLSCRRQQPLLHGWSLHVTPNTRPPPLELREVIESAGGVWLERPPRSGSDRLAVVSCAEDAALWPAARRLRLPVVSAELLLTGVLRQKVDISQHLLTH